MLRKTVGAFSSKFLSAIVNFLVVIIISRTLGAEGKGISTLLMANITIILIFCDVAGSAPMAYMIPRYNLKQLAYLSYGWNIVICILSYLTLIQFKVEYAMATSSLVFFHSLGGVNRAILIGKENIKVVNILNIVKQLLTISVLVLLYYVNDYLTFQSYLIALYVSFILNFILSFSAIYRYFQNTFHVPYLRIFKDCLKFGSWNQSAHIFQFLNFRISYYIIDNYVGKSQLGIYSNGLSIIESIWLIAQSVSLIQYSRIINIKDVDKAIPVSIEAMKSAGTLTMLSCLFLCLLPGRFYVFLFGQEFETVRSIVLIMVPGIVIYTFALILGHHFSGTGKVRINTEASFIGLVFTVVTGFFLVKSYGIIGAAITANISYAATSGYVLVRFMANTKTNFIQFIPSKKDMQSIILNIKSAKANAKKNY